MCVSRNSRPERCKKRTTDGTAAARRDACVRMPLFTVPVCRYCQPALCLPESPCGRMCALPLFQGPRSCCVMKGSSPCVCPGPGGRTEGRYISSTLLQKCGFSTLSAPLAPRALAHPLLIGYPSTPLAATTLATLSNSELERVNDIAGYFGPVRRHCPVGAGAHHA